MKSQLAHLIRPGDNHTGVALHPELVDEMLKGTVEFGPTSEGNAELIAQARIRAAKRSAPVATMPPAPAASELLRLLDKLGARLHFERIGVRLYEALIAKLDAYGELEGGPARADLEHIRDQEFEHLALAHKMIVGLEGDPTVVTPCAALQMAASRGICDVILDSRTTLIEGLEAILIAELADHESWRQLLAAVTLAGEAALEAEIRQAEATEAEHLARVRTWLSAAGKLAAPPVH